MGLLPKKSKKDKTPEKKPEGLYVGLYPSPESKATYSDGGKISDEWAEAKKSTLFVGENPRRWFYVTAYAQEPVFIRSNAAAQALIAELSKWVASDPMRDCPGLKCGTAKEERER